MHTKLGIWLMLMLGLAVVFASPAMAQQPAGQITALRVRGEVTATTTATGAVVRLANNAAVSQGTVVTTAAGASVVLMFSNGASVSLGAGSSLDIEQFTQDPLTTSFNPSAATAEPTTSTTRLNLSRGDIVARVKTLNRGGGSSFDVVTPVGAAGVRGTVFRIVYTPSATGTAQFSIVATEGEVGVTLATGTVAMPPISVTAGTEISVEVNITVDPTTGTLVVTLPVAAGTITATPAQPASLAAVAAVATELATVVANVVITPDGGLVPALPAPILIPEVQIQGSAF